MYEIPHGEIKLTTQGGIIIARYVGQFNLQGLQIGVDNIRAIIDQFNNEPFAMLIDDLDLIGGTPEAYAELERFNQWLGTQKLIAKATVIDSSVKLKIIDSLVCSRATQNHQAFSDVPTALSWLSDQLQKATG